MCLAVKFDITEKYQCDLWSHMQCFDHVLFWFLDITVEKLPKKTKTNEVAVKASQPNETNAKTIAC